MPANATKHVYRIIFYQDDNRYDLYAKHILSSEDMMGFVGIADIIFNEASGTIIDSAEEKLKAAFGDVKCCYIPYHNVVRIDEVIKVGNPTVIDANTVGQSKVIRPSAFANTILPPSQD